MRLSIKTLLVVLAVIAFAVWSVLDVREKFSVSTGENLKRVNWLPSSASNISYYRNYHFTAYQFEMSESEFVNWCPKTLAEIEKPISISTWKTRLIDFPKPDSNTTAAQFDAMIDKYDSETTVVVKRGLFYEHWADNGGCSIYVFDRTNSMGYHQWSPR